MQNYEEFYRFLETTPLKDRVEDFKGAVERACARPDGNVKKWLEALALLPEMDGALCSKGGGPVVLRAEGLCEEKQGQLEAGLLGLSPWRKGPFDFFGVYVDSEWRSDFKWDRIKDEVSHLKDRLVLDVGCGNGFYMVKMAEQLPKLVLGVDPMSIFVAQFAALNKYLKLPSTFLLPLGFEDLPEKLDGFDTVFCMGVFYHRRSPFEFLGALKDLLRPSGELVFETLTVDGGKDRVLVPINRYAKMRNVWFIPSELAMEHWLVKAGFKNIRLVDSSKTTVEEQRTTKWMTNKSLVDFLDSKNPDLTIEGLPAPVRSVFICNK